MIEAFRIEPEAIYDDGALRQGIGITSSALAAARRSGALQFARKGNRTLYKGAWVLAWIDPSSSAPEATGQGVKS